MTTRTKCRVCRGVNPELTLPVGLVYCDCQANPKFWRGARITVQVSRDWLTADGDYTEAEGWTELTEELTKSLTSYGLTADVKLMFEEWDGEPEPAGPTYGY